MRLFLTEYASLPWTHQHAGLSRRSPSGVQAAAVHRERLLDLGSRMLRVVLRDILLKDLLDVVGERSILTLCHRNKFGLQGSINLQGYGRVFHVVRLLQPKSSVYSRNGPSDFFHLTSSKL